MAKKGKGKGKVGRTVRIPKSIGGMKLPKAVRKPAENLIARAQTPEGRRMIAAGLAMAASAVAAKANAPRPTPPEPPVPPRPSMPPAPPTPPRPPEGATPVDPQAIADAVGKAASAFVDGFFGRRR